MSLNCVGIVSMKTQFHIRTLSIYSITLYPMFEPRVRFGLRFGCLCFFVRNSVSEPILFTTLGGRNLVCLVFIFPSPRSYQEQWGTSCCCWSPLKAFDWKHINSLGNTYPVRNDFLLCKAVLVPERSDGWGEIQATHLAFITNFLYL